MAKGMREKWQDPDPWTRVQVFEAWGVSPDEQEVMESLFREYTFTPDVIDDHIFNETPILRAVLP